MSKQPIQRREHPRLKPLAVLLASACTTFGLPALSYDASGPLSERVAFGDLDLTKSPGTVVLYGRIRSAAKNVCRPLEDRSLSRMAAWRSCVDKAIASAVAGVGSSPLTAYHEARLNARSPSKGKELASIATAHVGH